MEKSARLGLVLTPVEKKAATVLADKEGGLSVSALIRRLIRDAAEQAGAWPPTAHQDQRPGEVEQCKT